MKKQWKVTSGIIFAILYVSNKGLIFKISNVPGLKRPWSNYYVRKHEKTDQQDRPIKKCVSFLHMRDRHVYM